MQQPAIGFRRLLVLAPLAVGLGLSACTVQPLYAPDATGQSVRAELAAISVLPAPDRITQIVRNELIFSFTGGGAAAASRYELSLAVTTGPGSFDVTAPGNEPSTGVAVMGAFQLVEIATGTVVTQGSARAETRYTQSNQQFANVRAEDDAAERAALEVAEQILQRVSLALAARP